MIHVIAYSILALSLIRLTYVNFRKENILKQMFQYNTDVTNKFEELYQQLVNSDEELRLTTMARDMYLEDRNSLIENMKAFLPKQK